MGMTVMFHNLYLSRDDILSCQLSGSRSKQSNIPEINYTHTLEVKNGIPSVYCNDNNRYPLNLGRIFYEMVWNRTKCRM